MENTKLEELEAQVESLKKEVTKLKDIEAINILQKAYGYYLEHWMSQEVIDLFADGPDVALTLGAGTYVGKEGVIRYFNHIDARPRFLHQVMLVSGIVTVDDDGINAKGRWYGWGSFAGPGAGGIKQNFFNGIYNCDYVKENGIWKIKTMRFDQIYDAVPALGWVEPELAAPLGTNIPSKCKADIPRDRSYIYPSGYIVPFYYKHPVTGKETTEAARNEAVKNAGNH